MKSINRTILLGNLTADAELKYSQSGSPVATFSLATNYGVKQPDGSYQDHADFHRLVAFGKLAEFADKYLTRGRRVYVEGRLQTKSWETEDGGKRSSTEIVAQEVILLDSRKDTAETV